MAKTDILHFESHIDWFIKFAKNKYGFNLENHFKDPDFYDYQFNDKAPTVYNVIKRLKLVEELKLESKEETRFKSFFGLETSLRIYFTCTCFDMLGQTNDYIHFGNWIASELIKNQNVITRLGGIDFTDTKGKIEKTKEVAQLVFEEYNKEYGNRQSFKRFFLEIIEKDHDRILKDIRIIKNPYYPYHGIVNFNSSILNTWDKKSKEKKLTEISDFIYINCRNLFTHSGIDTYDNWDVPKTTLIESFFERKIESQTELKHLVHKNRESFEVVNSIFKSFSLNINNINIYLKISEDEKIHLYSSTDFPVSSFFEFWNRNNEDRKKKLLQGSDIYSNDKKKILYLRQGSFTQFLISLSEIGLINYIKLNFPIAQDTEVS